MKNKQYLIELSDEEYRIVTTGELAEIEKDAEEFDGFTGTGIVASLPVSESSPTFPKYLYALSIGYLRNLDLTRRSLGREYENQFVLKALRIAAGLEDYIP